VSDLEAQRLQASVQAFVRTFGLLVTKQTPCGQPVSPSYAHALMLLLERESSGRTTSQSELAAELGLDKSSITRLCARLEADQRVTQRSPEDDRRSRLLELTSRGRKLATQVQAASQERFRQVLEAVPPKKRRGLLAALGALTQAVATLKGGDS
jgi:DNA-binding MarR family transcriptional regulator